MKRALFLACFFSIFTFCVSAFAATKLPILMYHSIEEKSTGEYSVSKEQFRNDMEFLNKNGYTTLLSQDILKIKNGEMEMPQKPVMITFDDGYENNYTIAYPILKENKMKATIALIGILIRDGNGSGREGYLNWEQVKEMYDSGLIDIGTHTYNLHDLDETLHYVGTNRGIRPLKNEPTQQYLTRTSMDLKRGIGDIEKKLGNDVIYFAYPFGMTNGHFSSIIGGYGIKVSVTTKSEMANIEKNTKNLSRFNVTASKPVSVILSK